MPGIDDPGECGECGFVPSAVVQANAVETIRGLGVRYRSALRSAALAIDAEVRRRPAADTWSALEYTAHMRDVVATWSSALHRMLNEHSPRLFTPDPALADRAAAAAGYNDQDPATVEQELSANAERMAKEVGTIRPDQWHRAAHFGGIEVTPLWVVRHVAHEGHHHLMDVQRSMDDHRSP